MGRDDVENGWVPRAMICPDCLLTKVCQCSSSSGSGSASAVSEMSSFSAMFAVRSSAVAVASLTHTLSVISQAELPHRDDVCARNNKGNAD